MDYLIIFDGGSRNNGSPDAEAYGSYHIKTAAGRGEIKRIQFWKGTTNNETEYKSLIVALRELMGRSERANRAVSQYTMEIRGTVPW
jgi:ribonuclease HI